MAPLTVVAPVPSLWASSLVYSSGPSQERGIILGCPVCNSSGLGELSNGHADNTNNTEPRKKIKVLPRRIHYKAEDHLKQGAKVQSNKKLKGGNRFRAWSLNKSVQSPK